VHAVPKSWWVEAALDVLDNIYSTTSEEMPGSFGAHMARDLTPKLVAFGLNEWMCNTAREIEAATQPLSHSGRAADAATQPHSHSATQPLSHSATLAEQLTQPLSHSVTQPLSHSATQPLWAAEWLSGWSSLSGRVAEWLSGWSSHSGRVAEWLSGWSSHSAAATQPLSHSERLTGWVAGEPLECKQYYPDLIFLRSG